mmetsp:Transcript_26722/g.58577  ORF Transcript_26722/g.58577 Transcript_26722/m.58577 type:complete len:518 (+) Transcript_26722:419-1972(+)
MKDILFETTESTPLLSKNDGSDQSSDGTLKTYDTSEESSSSSLRSNEFHPDPSSIVISLHGSIDNGNDNGNDNDNDNEDHKHEHIHIHKHGHGHENVCEEMEGLPSIIEGVVEEFHDITEAAFDEIHKADEDENYMIEMGLTRNLSILHDDVVEASGVLQGGSEDQNDIETGCGDTGGEPSVAEVIIPLGAYLLLFSAIVAMSTVGPLLQLQDDTTATMKVLWRMVGTSILLAPLAFVDVCYHSGMPKLTSPQWFTFFLSTFWFVVMAIGFCLSLDYTSVGNAVILSNSLALILLVGRLCTGAHVTMLEFTGAMVAFSGAVLCSRDAADAMDNGNIDSGGLGATLIGDLLAIASAIGGVGYVTMAKTSRAHVSLCVFMFLTMSVGSVMVLIFQLTVLREKVTWDCDPSHGFWGFLVWNRFDRLPLELMMVLICNLVGTMGYVRAMPHFDSIVICSVQLLEPVIAEFLSYFAGVGVLPGILGWIGNAAVAGGTLVVLYESQKPRDASRASSNKPKSVD